MNANRHLDVARTHVRMATATSINNETKYSLPSVALVIVYSLPLNLIVCEDDLNDDDDGDEYSSVRDQRCAILRFLRIHSFVRIKSFIEICTVRSFRLMPCVCVPVISSVTSCGVGMISAFTPNQMKKKNISASLSHSFYCLDILSIILWFISGRKLFSSCEDASQIQLNFIWTQNFVDNLFGFVHTKHRLTADVWAKWSKAKPDDVKSWDVKMRFSNDMQNVSSKVMSHTHTHDTHMCVFAIIRERSRVRVFSSTSNQTNGTRCRAKGRAAACSWISILWP